MQVGPGKLTLTGSSNYGSNNTFANGGNGGTQVSGGTLQIGSGGNTGSITNDVYLSNNGTLAFSHSDNVVFAGTIMDDGLGGTGLVQLGPGMLTLNNCSNYSFVGTASVCGGTLQLSDYTNDTMTGKIINAGIFVFNEPDGGVFSGTISGSGSVVQLGRAR